MSHDVAIVFGTRPEAIKLAVLADLLGDRAELIHTGQHFDANLAADIATDLGMRPPDVQLDIGGSRRGTQIGAATQALTEHFAASRPSAVIVQGDTNSALAGAIAANAESIRLVHVEAGLRSHDRNMPEEHNRVLIDHLADVCAAPTDLAAKNLAAEGIGSERVAVTGNTVVEAVTRMTPDPAARAALWTRLGVDTGAYAVATIHRPENVDDPDTLREVLRGLAAIGVPVIMPLHPRTRARVAEFDLARWLDALTVIDPLPYSDFLALTADASVVISDSGGIQEEASILKFPVLVTRRSTERSEAIGTFAELISVRDIAARATALLTDTNLRSRLTDIPSPFGDGRASERISQLV